MMKLAQLRYFVAVARAGTFTRAAEHTVALDVSNEAQVKSAFEATIVSIQPTGIVPGRVRVHA